MASSLEMKSAVWVVVPRVWQLHSGCCAGYVQMCEWGLEGVYYLWVVHFLSVFTLLVMVAHIP